MFVSLKDFRIAAVSVVTGDRVIALDDELDAYGGDRARVERLKKATGLAERVVVSGKQTTVDLAEQAVADLVAAGHLRLDDIDACLFVTQTPDFFQPPNSAVLHGKLGLSKGVACWDMNLGCSGWVYGVMQAGTLLQTGAFQKVLLLAGDTISRQVDPDDRATAPLFGDAASATLLECEPGREFSAVLGTDGVGWDAIQVPAGAFRKPLAQAGTVLDAEGNPHGEEFLLMDGAEVFKFSLREVPAAIGELFEKSGVTAEQVRYFFFHQANAYILSNLRRRLKVDAEKVPCETLSRYGNLSSASIPAVLCDKLSGKDGGTDDSLRVVLGGFGVGLSWAMALTDLRGVDCLPVRAYGQN